MQMDILCGRWSLAQRAKEHAQGKTKRRHGQGGADPSKRGTVERELRSQLRHACAIKRRGNYVRALGPAVHAWPRGPGTTTPAGKAMRYPRATAPTR